MSPRAGVLLAVAALSLAAALVWQRRGGPGTIDRSCRVDSDCAMRQIDCGACAYGSEGGAVNKDWVSACPAREPTICPMAVPNWSRSKAACRQGLCVEVRP